MCCLDDCCCCGCGCYDSFCERCCPCVSYDTRETIFGCCVCLLLLGAAALLAVLLAAYGFIRHVEVSVDSASLTRFALSAASPATALAYNLSLTLAVRNRNWAMSIKSTAPLEADYSFDGQRFDRVRLADAGAVLPAGKTRVYHLDSGAGAAYAALGNAGAAEFARENATGAFQIEVALAGEVRYQAHATKCKLAATCPLKLQLAPPGTPAVAFQLVKCKLAKPDKNC
ncbi:hypothetical protein U9M48_012307 [Paspalum notatum var. saurae]|uniref:Late embryogenesis abundant protein LEA-2 subgroup domain-containing protein n=1 Tax=Paspalum notatum var. saurae TaxID=547442 RepID=A0AAQ3SXL0_PASNO